MAGMLTDDEKHEDEATDGDADDGRLAQAALRASGGGAVGGILARRRVGADVDVDVVRVGVVAARGRVGIRSRSCRVVDGNAAVDDDKTSASPFENGAMACATHVAPALAVEVVVCTEAVVTVTVGLGFVATVLVGAAVVVFTGWYAPLS